MTKKRITCGEEKDSAEMADSRRKKCECCGRRKRLDDQISERHPTCYRCWDLYKRMSRILAREAGEAPPLRLTVWRTGGDICDEDEVLPPTETAPHATS